MVSYINPFSENFILKGVLEFLGNILDYINPFSDDFILKGVLDFLGSIINYINPFSENFILKDIISYINPFSDKFILKDVLEFLGNILDYINPFSENFILKSVLKFLGSIIDYINPFSDDFILKDLFSWIGSFFNNLFNFFIHIFVPTDEQWADLSSQDEAIGEKFESKFPFIFWFQDELEKAEEYVFSNDFLNIKFSSWNLDLGIIKYNTPEINFTAIRDAYEPYRLTIRNSLFYIAVGLAIVYVIKYILNFGVTSSDVHTLYGEGGKDSGGNEK